MIYIILPAYNEEKGLSDLLGEIKKTINKEVITFAYQVVLINDGSTDHTGEIAYSSAKNLSLRIITHEKNRGLGEALKSGLNYIFPYLKNEDVVITLDADNTHSPGLIPQMVEKINQEGEQLVIASRFCQGGKEVGLHFFRRFLSRGAYWILSFFFLYQGVKDYTSGYRAYSGNLLKQATALYGEKFITEKGFTVMVEILIKLRKLKPKICEIPLSLRYDLKKSKSKIKIVPTVVRYFILLIKNIILKRNC
jgi:dolichol-phosphate mannosyltransferase